MKKELVYESCRKKLIKMRNLYEKTLNRPKDYRSSGEPVDMAQSEVHIRSSSFLRTKMAQTLPEIHRALNRLELGTFGICEITGDNIEPSRLLAIPWTRFSRIALEELEEVA